MASNCVLSNLSPIASSIHWLTNDSKALLIVMVNDIGLISCSTDLGGFIMVSLQYSSSSRLLALLLLQMQGHGRTN